MGSPPTVTPTPHHRPSLDRPDQDRAVTDGHAELLAHLQTPAAVGGHEFGEWPVDQIAGGFGGDLQARHRHDHTRLANQFTHTHPELSRDPVREGERAFDRLNPDYGVPADQRSHYGRQNDRNPVIWQPGQDYRMADALHAARAQPTRTRRGPERVGPER